MLAILLSSVLFPGTTALDPVSLLVMDGTMTEVVGGSALVTGLPITFLSDIQSTNLNGAELGYTTYSNGFVANAEQKTTQLYFGLIQQAQRYHYHLDSEQYDLYVENAEPFIGFGNDYLQLYMSPENWKIHSGISAFGAQLNASFGHWQLPLQVEVRSDKLDVNEQLDFLLQQNRCNVSAQWWALQLKAVCDWRENSFEFSGLSAAYHNDVWQLEAGYRNNEFNASDDWQIDQIINGDTETNISQQRWFAAVAYQEWELSYQSRVVDGDMLSQLDIQDRLVSGVGKGRYFVTGQFDFRQRQLGLQPPVWDSAWGRFSWPLSLSYIDDVEVNADIYEPLLFLGLPVLTDSQALSIESVLVSVAQFQWQKEWHGWIVFSEASQVIPLSVQETKSGSESGGGGGGNGGGEPTTPVEPDEKKALFWPGFSLKVGLRWQF
ncbi:MAG: hypothetical protein P8X74_03295 [Reinekea sp.]